MGVKIAAAVLSARRPISDHGYCIVRDAAAVGGFKTVQSYPPAKTGCDDNIYSPLVNQTDDWLNALKFATTLDPSADLFVVFEDDIQIAAGLAEYLEKTMESFGGSAAFFSPYSPALYFQHPAYSAIQGSDPWVKLGRSCQLIGACCLAFPRQSAKLILSDPKMREAIRDNIPIEKYLRHWANMTNRPIYFHRPSLIRHLGLTKPGDQDSQSRKEGEFLAVAPTISVGVNQETQKHVEEMAEQLDEREQESTHEFIWAKRYEPPLVSIIIAGRNSQEFIGAAINSACRQTCQDCEVIVSDDASTDGTHGIISRLKFSGLSFTFLADCMHAGVVEARNRGAAVARGRYLCFLDADDIMPPDYIEKHLKTIWNRCFPFVYGSALAFGDGKMAGKHWFPKPFAEWDRWGYNTVNTSALYARWAFEAAGRWQEVPTMWDFDLALRASRFGTPAISEAVLMYRQHAGSWSQSVDLAHGDSVRGKYSEVIHRRNARLAVATILSGRMSQEFQLRWIDAVASTVRQAALNHKPILFVAEDPACHLGAGIRAITGYGNAFSAVRIERMPFHLETYTNEQERRHSVSRFLAKANQFIKSFVSQQADAVWIVEDDILVPVTACAELWETLTSGRVCPAAVTGVYRNRHNPKLIVGGTADNLDIGPFHEFETIPREKVVPVDVVGCGCLMTWIDRPMIPEAWPSHVAGTVTAHDWAYSLAIRRNGGEVLMNTHVRCGHAVNDSEILWPEK